MKTQNNVIITDTKYETDIKYPISHWAMAVPSLEDDNIVGIYRENGSDFVIKMNPTDARGYRCIVALIDIKDMSKSLNRKPTEGEYKGLMKLVGEIYFIYLKMGLIPQLEMAGNNSHSFDKNTKITSIGKIREPSMFHAHIFGRGNPTHDYFPEIPLLGPFPGEMFNMRGDGVKYGNTKKEKWQKGQIKLISRYLRKSLE